MPSSKAVMNEECVMEWVREAGSNPHAVRESCVNQPVRMLQDSSIAHPGPSAR